MHTVYVVSSTDEALYTMQHITAKTTIWVDFEDRKNHQYGIITGIIDPPTGALAIPDAGTAGSLKDLFDKQSGVEVVGPPSPKVSGDPATIVEDLGLTHVLPRNSSVNIVDGTPAFKEWLKVLNGFAAAANHTILMTSAVRTDYIQALIMYNNYVNKGGGNSKTGAVGNPKVSRDYLVGLYGSRTAPSIADHYDSVASGVSKEQAINAAAEIIKTKWSHASGHLSHAGVDLVPYNLATYKVIKDTAAVTGVSVLDEYDHFHCAITSATKGTSKITCHKSKYSKCISHTDDGKLV